MAHATTAYADVINISAQASPPTAEGLVARLSRTLAEYRAYRTVHDELSALTDRELADLDISRLNVRDIAREAVYGH